MNYVPLLKVKAGELKAIFALSDKIKPYVKPYHELLDDVNPDRTGSYFDTFTKDLFKYYGNKEMDFFIDFSKYNGGDPVDVLSFLNAAGLRYTIGITNFKMPQDKMLAIKEQGFFQDGVAFRFMVKDIRSVNLLQESLFKLSDMLEIRLTNIDFLLDFGYVNTDQVGLELNFFRSFVEKLDVSGFKSFSCTSGSFPKDMSNIEVNTVQHLPRYEKKLFNKVLKIYPGVIYSDYGNMHPVYDPSVANYSGSCSLKYTTEENYQIHRGTKPSMSPEGNGQYIKKCMEIVVSDGYDGSDYSYGDTQIFRLANGDSNKPGNSRTWITNTLNHHITRVARERAGV